MVAQCPLLRRPCHHPRGTRRCCAPTQEHETAELLRLQRSQPPQRHPHCKQARQKSHGRSETRGTTDCYAAQHSHLWHPLLSIKLRRSWSHKRSNIWLNCTAAGGCCWLVADALLLLLTCHAPQPPPRSSKLDSPGARGGWSSPMSHPSSDSLALHSQARQQIAAGCVALC